jgi:hypothetical protein
MSNIPYYVVFVTTAIVNLAVAALWFRLLRAVYLRSGSGPGGLIVPVVTTLASTLTVITLVWTWLR